VATDDVCPVFGETYLTPLHVDDASTLSVRGYWYDDEPGTVEDAVSLAPGAGARVRAPARRGCPLRRRGRPVTDTVKRVSDTDTVDDD
jgi:hypothetical protein